MAEEYQQTLATAQGDDKVVRVDVVDLKGKEDDQKFHDEIIGYEKADVEDVQAMTKVGEGEKLGCDTSSGSDSKSSKSNSVSSKSYSDSDSKNKSVSNSGTEKKRIKRRAQKVKLSKQLAEKGEEKIGMVTEMDVNKDGAEGTKLLEEGDDKLHDKLQCVSSDSGSKSGSDSNSKSGSDSSSKLGSSTINAKAKSSIRKGLKEKIKEQTSMKTMKEDKKNDPLISLEANKSDDKETKMVEEGDENKQHMLEWDSSDSGSKSGSDSGSKSGSVSASKFGLGADMAVIVERLEEPMKTEGSLDEKKSF